MSIGLWNFGCLRHLHLKTLYAYFKDFLKRFPCYFQFINRHHLVVLHISLNFPWVLQSVYQVYPAYLLKCYLQVLHLLELLRILVRVGNLYFRVAQHYYFYFTTVLFDLMSNPYLITMKGKIPIKRSVLYIW